MSAAQPGALWAEAPPADVASCSIGAWSKDRDPQGLNVRAAPSVQAPVVGALPPRAPLGEGDPEVAVTFEVIGSENGWLLIRNAVDEASPQRGAFAGTGWVSGRMVDFTVQSAKGHARPDAGSRVIVDLGEEWLGDVADIEAVVACAGEWVLVEARVRPAEPLDPGAASAARVRPGLVRAWFRRVCANQLTTCDGLVDD